MDSQSELPLVKPQYVTTSGATEAAAGVDPGITATRVDLARRKPVAPAIPGAIGPIDALIDTGASHDNYISEEVAEMLGKAGSHRCPCSTKICSGLGNQQFCVD